MSGVRNSNKNNNNKNNNNNKKYIFYSAFHDS